MITTRTLLMKVHFLFEKAKSYQDNWLNYTDFASVYIMANALIENYCELRDNDYKRLLTMVTGE